MGRLPPEAIDRTSHRLARLHGFSGDVVCHDIIRVSSISFF